MVWTGTIIFLVWGVGGDGWEQMPTLHLNTLTVHFLHNDSECHHPVVLTNRTNERGRSLQNDWSQQNWQDSIYFL